MSARARVTMYERAHRLHSITSGDGREDRRREQMYKRPRGGCSVVY